VNPCQEEQLLPRTAERDSGTTWGHQLHGHLQSHSLGSGFCSSWPLMHTASAGIKHGTATALISQCLIEGLKQFKIIPVKGKWCFPLISPLN